MIYETIITSADPKGKVHVAPFGVRERDGFILISPFKPSTTLTNILETKQAVLNLTDDVRVFAAAVTDRQCYETIQTSTGFRLDSALAHSELTLVDVKDDETRPELTMRIDFEQIHRPFKGFNRAQAAVIELAVLVSRLHLLPQAKIQTEMAYLQIAMDKTAGDREWQAWRWLVGKIENFQTSAL